MRLRRLAVLLALAALTAAIAFDASRSASSAAGKGEFLADCPLSHRLIADPIVFPNRRRAGHRHDFYGNRATRGRSTNAQLRRSRRTTCAPRADRSAYWTATLTEGSRTLTPEQVTVYYTVEPELAAELKPYPRDLRIVAGNAKERGRVPGAPNVWSCLGADVDGDPGGVRCPAGSKLELLLNFPDCWDGRRSDSRDHQSHMAYSQGGECPDRHPVAVPQVQFKIRWPTRGGPGVQLASGNAFSAHGDFMNAWDPDALQQRIDRCLKPLVKCGADGEPLG